MRTCAGNTPRIAVLSTGKCVQPKTNVSGAPRGSRPPPVSGALCGPPPPASGAPPARALGCGSNIGSRYRRATASAMGPSTHPPPPSKRTASRRGQSPRHSDSNDESPAGTRARNGAFGGDDRDTLRSGGRHRGRRTRFDDAADRNIRKVQAQGVERRCGCVLQATTRQRMPRAVTRRRIAANTAPRFPDSSCRKAAGGIAQ